MSNSFVCSFNENNVDIKTVGGIVYLNAMHMCTIVQSKDDKDGKQVLHRPRNWLLSKGIKEYIKLRAIANDLTYDQMVMKLMFNGNESYYFHHDICIGYAFVIHPEFASYLTEQFKRIQSGDLTLAAEIKQTHERITDALEQQLIAKKELLKKTNQEIEDFSLKHLAGVVGQLMMCKFFKGDQEETTEQERRKRKSTSDENEAKIKLLMPAWKQYQEDEKALFRKLSQVEEDVIKTKADLKKRHLATLHAATEVVYKQRDIIYNCYDRLELCDDVSLAHLKLAN